MIDSQLIPCPTCGTPVPLEQHDGTVDAPHIIREHGSGDCAVTVFAVVTHWEEASDA